MKLISGDQYKAVIRAKTQDSALSYFYGRFGVRGVIVAEATINLYTVQRK